MNTSTEDGRKAPRGALTKQQTAELTAALSDADVAYQQRAQAILWWYDGMSVSVISVNAKVSPTAVRSWIAKFRQGGVDALRMALPSARVQRPALRPLDADVVEAGDRFFVGIARGIKAARLRRGWTRADLIAQIGVAYTPANLSAWEMPSRRVQTLPLVLICRALGLSLDELTSEAARGTLDGLWSAEAARDVNPW